MRYVAKIEIENFQSHAKTVIAFGPGMNAITGPTDNGKSAILRALKWVLYNEPRGSEFVRSGARECRVKVTISDGAEITREIQLKPGGGTARNRYLLTRPGAEPQVFEGFGTDVPQEILAAHGMPAVRLDTDKTTTLNFGSQLEGPFLMAETGSFRAKAIGRLLGVHVVDAAIRMTQRDMKTVKADTIRLEADVDRLNTALEPYEDIPEQEARVMAAEAALEQLGPLQELLQSLAASRQRLQELGAQLVAAAASVNRFGKAVQAAEPLMFAEVADQRRIILAGAADRLGRICIQQALCDQILTRTRQVEVAEWTLQGAQSIHERYSQLRGVSVKLDAVLVVLRINGQQLVRATIAEAAEPKLAKAQAAHDQHAKLIQRRLTLSVVQANLAGAQDIIHRTAGAQAASTALLMAGECHGRIDKLKPAKAALERLETMIAKTECAAALYRLQEAAGVPMASVAKVQLRLDTLAYHRNNLTETEAKLAKGREVIRGIEVRMVNCAVQYAQALQDAGVCPTCLQTIDPDTAAQIAATITQEECARVS